MELNATVYVVPCWSNVDWKGSSRTRTTSEKSLIRSSQSFLFLPSFPLGTLCALARSLLLLLSLWKQLLLYPSSLAPFPQRFALMKIWRREREDPSLEETSNLDNILPNFSGTENVKSCEAKVKELLCFNRLAIAFGIRYHGEILTYFRNLLCCLPNKQSICPAGKRGKRLIATWYRLILHCSPRLWQGKIN